MAARSFGRIMLASACLAAVGVVQGAPTQTRAEIVQIADHGARGLALRLMDEQQPEAAKQPQQWIAWERTRIRLLEGAKAWRRGLERLQQRPPDLPASFDRWAETRQARFHLQLGEPAAARQRLRALVWGGRGSGFAEKLRQWRRLIVRSYLVEGRVDDALTAMRRYDQDYDAPERAWVDLRARVLLRSGNAAEAARGLAAHESSEQTSRALTLLARWRSGDSAGGAVAAEARKAAQAEGVSAAARARFWFVVARAAPSAPAAALATERASALAPALPAEDRLFRMDGDALWQAWLAHARWYANQNELLIGDDAAWFEAVRAAEPRYPVRARALLALLARHGGPAASRRAHEGLVQRLGDSDLGMPVVRHAYLRASYYPEARDIPALVRYELVNDALERDDVTLASRLFADLGEAPPGVDPLEWGILRARVLILGGRGEAGAEGLDQLLDAFPRLEGKRLDRLLQVVFDLQGGGYHEAALGLLKRLARRERAGQRKRELLYWQAESYEALERYERAAQLYMRSALLVEGRASDQWGQTARYQAGRMLAEAGLVGDARRIFRDLLAVTDSEERRTSLRRRLHKLGLREAAPGNLPASTDGVSP